MLGKPVESPTGGENTKRREGHSPFSQVMSISCLCGQALTMQGLPNTTLSTNYKKRKTKTFNHASLSAPGTQTHSGLHLGQRRYKGCMWSGRVTWEEWMESWVLGHKELVYGCSTRLGSTFKKLPAFAHFSLWKHTEHTVVPRAHLIGPNSRRLRAPGQAVAKCGPCSCLDPLDQEHHCLRSGNAQRAHAGPWVSRAGMQLLSRWPGHQEENAYAAPSLELRCCSWVPGYLLALVLGASR